MKHSLRLLSAVLVVCMGSWCVPLRATGTDLAVTLRPARHAALTAFIRSTHGNGIDVVESATRTHISSAGIGSTGGIPSRTAQVPGPPIPALRLEAGAAPDGGGQCHGNEVVAVGHDVKLPAGQNACDVVAIFGNAVVHGDVSDSVVSVFGNSDVDGAVGNSAVAVLGNLHIGRTVGQSAVAVLGSVDLGPRAVIGGRVVSILGSATSTPTTVIRGGTVNLMSGLVHALPGLQAWSTHCLIFGRLLAPRLDIGWAWGAALAVLALYLLLAALFREGLGRCVRTLEDHPGPSILAALAMVLLTPVLMLALVMTIIGIAVIPVFWFALFCAGVFGRVVALGWLGGRLLRAHPATAAQPVLHVLAGGVVVLLLYMVPLLGFVTWAAIGLLGFGALSYTLLLAIHGARSTGPGLPSGAGPQAGRGTGSAPFAGPASPGGDPLASQTWTAGSTTPGAGRAQDPVADGPAAQATGWNAPTLPRAGFWLRMGALLIDLVLVGFALGLIGHHGADGLLLVLAGYGAVMWKLHGSTVGGIICNLKVVRLDGRAVGWDTAVLRALGCFLSLLAAGLGFIWIAFDREHQAWHDKIAGTVVVRGAAARGLA